MLSYKYIYKSLGQFHMARLKTDHYSLSKGIYKKETEFGNLYIISRDFSQTDPEFYEDIREGLNEN